MAINKINKIARFKLATSMVASAAIGGISQMKAPHVLKLTRANWATCGYSQADIGSNSVEKYKKVFPIRDIPLPFGGYKEEFDINGKKVFALVTPPGFNTLKASNTELEIYGLQPRPSDEKSLKIWLEHFMHYHGARVPYLLAEDITSKNLHSSATANTIAPSAPTTNSSQLSHKASISNQAGGPSNWGGYLVKPRNLSNEGMSYVSADMQMPNIFKIKGQCSNWAASEWVGIGGYHGSGAEPYFMQAGEVQQEGHNHINGPFLEYFDPKDSGEQVVPCMMFNLGDKWNFSISYDSKNNGTFIINFDDLSEGQSYFSATSNQTGCPSFNGKQEFFSDVTLELTGLSSAYGPSKKNNSAEWIVEDPTNGSGQRYALGNFGIATVSNAQAGYYKNLEGNQIGPFGPFDNFKVGSIANYDDCLPNSPKGYFLIGHCYQLFMESPGGSSLADTSLINLKRQGFFVKWEQCTGLIAE